MWLDPESDLIRRAITLDNYTTCVHTDAAAVRQKRNKIKEEEREVRRCSEFRSCVKVEVGVLGSRP